MADPERFRRLDGVTTGETPLEDVFGPPEELNDMVEIMRERGEPVPPRWLELLAEWRANNDEPEGG